MLVKNHITHCLKRSSDSSSLTERKPRPVPCSRLHLICFPSYLPYLLLFAHLLCSMLLRHDLSQTHQAGFHGPGVLFRSPHHLHHTCPRKSHGYTLFHDKSWLKCHPLSIPPALSILNDVANLITPTRPFCSQNSCGRLHNNPSPCYCYSGTVTEVTPYTTILQESAAFKPTLGYDKFSSF